MCNLSSTDSAAVLCNRCGKPGAGCHYKGSVYHMTCKMERKADERHEAEHGEWPELPPDVIPSALTAEQRAELEALTADAGTTPTLTAPMPDLAALMVKHAPAV